MPETASAGFLATKMKGLVMGFAKDRDLLVLEPNLFGDVAFTAQTLVDASGGASIAGTTLTLPGAQFDALGIESGHVAVVDRVSLEVVERLTAESLTVSKLRADREGPALAPSSGTDLPVMITTFAPQIEIVHEVLLRTIGIDVGDSHSVVSPSSIVNSSSLIQLESLGTLHLVFAAASALVSDEGLLWSKAQLYRQRFSMARGRARVSLDLDGDGRVDAVRTFNTLQFVRN